MRGSVYWEGGKGEEEVSMRVREELTRDSIGNNVNS